MPKCDYTMEKCPFSHDFWECGGARDAAQDNCPLGKYEPNDRFDEQRSVRIIDDWCKHLILNSRRNNKKQSTTNKTSAIDHPAHYQGQHECIDIMRAMFGDEAVKGFCRCNAYKYRYRAGKKDGNTAEQDLAKAEWYENYLIGMEKESNDN